MTNRKRMRNRRARADLTTYSRKRRGLPPLEGPSEKGTPIGWKTDTGEATAWWNPGVEGGPCANCRERPATQHWVGEGGVMSLIHGGAVWWCENCALKAQIDYAIEREAQIPVLRERLAKLEAQQNGF